MKAPGSPAWRKAGRPGPGGMNALNPGPLPAAVDDLAALDDDEFRRVVGREALLTMASVMRRPTRRALARLGAARDLANFSVAKPAQANTFSGPNGGPIEVTTMSPAETLRARRQKRGEAPVP